MPERPLLVAAYAAGAGLAAATLVYVFGPTFLLDEAKSKGGRSNAVGLTNPANDCFINSTLQALAGASELRLFLIRDVHLRKLLPNDLSGAKREDDVRKEKLRLSLLAGLITSALKDMLDALNERPISRKTISAQPIIAAVERAFNTRVSRYQQDAQEFLQILLERLSDEHKALTALVDELGTSLEPSKLVKTEAAIAALNLDDEEPSVNQPVSDLPGKVLIDPSGHPPPVNVTARVPFQGKLESQIECLVCHFKPKASTSDFVTLTLNVPSGSGATSLDTCFDGVLKQEHIDGFRCDRCRLLHALRLSSQKLGMASRPEERSMLEQHCAAIQTAIDTDPEKPPKDLELPPIASAPTSKITKHMRISLHPNILGIHLSRSMWDAHSSSSKNMAKVSFSDTLTLGPLLDRKTYRLFSVVTHKGGHNSGHYETFRRQRSYHPFSTTENAGSQAPSPLHSPRASASAQVDVRASTSDPALDSNSSAIELSNLDSTAKATLPSISKSDKRASLVHMNKAKKRPPQDRWWRISDDKVKECKISDVLSMQREVYLLFYELQQAS